MIHIKKGDIVLYRSGNGFISVRVITVFKYVFRGRLFLTEDHRFNMIDSQAYGDFIYSLYMDNVVRILDKEYPFADDLVK